MTVVICRRSQTPPSPGLVTNMAMASNKKRRGSPGSNSGSDSKRSKNNALLSGSNGEGTLASMCSSLELLHGAFTIKTVEDLPAQCR